MVCRHAQQQGLFRSRRHPSFALLTASGTARRTLSGVGAGLGGVLDVERHTDVLLDDAGLHRQRLVRLRRGLGVGEGVGVAAVSGVAVTMGVGLGSGAEKDRRWPQTRPGRCWRSAPPPCRPRPAYTAAAAQRCCRRNTAWGSFIKHSCSSQLKSDKLLQNESYQEKAPAASGQGWKSAQKNAEIFNIHRVCLWIIVTPRTQLSGI